MRLQVSDDERDVLLPELDGFLGMTAALYGQIGSRLDLRDAAGLAPDVALVVGVRDRLAGAGPWQIVGTLDELTLLLGRLRAGAELALQRGAAPSPGRHAVAMHRADTEGTDAQLDLLRVCDALMGRMDDVPAEAG